MKTLLIALLLTSFFFAHNTYAQTMQCGTSGKIQYSASQQLLVENHKKQKASARKTATNDTTVYTIPVVFHIIISPENEGDFKIQRSNLERVIEEVNKKYRNIGLLDGAGSDTRIQFKIAGDSTCATNYGIIRKNINLMPRTPDITTFDVGALRAYSRMDSARYLNIYIYDISANQGGFGFFGNDAFLNLNLVRSDIVAHELGHVLFLHHTFEGDDYNQEQPGVYQCPGSDPVLEGDLVEDTDPHTRVQTILTETNPCTGRPLGYVGLNAMSYAFTVQGFTPKQGERMRMHLETFMPGWINSENMPMPQIQVTANVFCSNSSEIQLTASTYWLNYQWMRNNVDIPGATSRTYKATENGVYKLKVNLCNEQIYSADVPITTVNFPPMATACNFQDYGGLGPFIGIANVSFNTINRNSSTSYIDGKNYMDFSCTDTTTVAKGQTYPISVTSANAIECYLNVYIDTNNDGDFIDNGELVYTATPAVVHNANILIPENIASNTFARMRVIMALKPITSPCLLNSNTNAGGQAEDYRLLISTCPLNMSINSPFSGSIIRKAENSIVANNTIASGNVSYQAGKAIILQSGMSIEQGTVFKAEIKACL